MLRAKDALWGHRRSSSFTLAVAEGPPVAVEVRPGDDPRRVVPRICAALALEAADCATVDGAFRGRLHDAGGWCPR